MATPKVGFDEETYRALLDDAARHLRYADWHAKAILRQALGPPFPYPADPTGQGVNLPQEHAA